MVQIHYILDVTAAFLVATTHTQQEHRTSKEPHINTLCAHTMCSPQRNLGRSPTRTKKYKGMQITKDMNMLNMLHADALISWLASMVAMCVLHGPIKQLCQWSGR